MITLLLHLLRLLPFLFGGYRQLAIENLALRQQLSVYKRTTTRPKLRTTERLFWVGLATLQRSIERVRQRLEARDANGALAYVSEHYRSGAKG